jgi:hypothetical protein
MNAIRLLTTGAAVSVALLLAPAACRAALSVPPGTAVLLQFDDEVSTKTAKKGDQIHLRVYADVVVNGKTLIKQDAPATGTVTDVRKPRSFGRRGELKVRLENVTDVTGARVPLEPYSTGDRFKASGPGAAGAGLVVLGPVGLVGGAFVKGNHVTIDKGTRIQAVVWDGKSKPESKPAKQEQPPVDFPDKRN